MQSNAAQQAAQTQANAAERAATMQADLGQESLAYQNYQYQQDAANQQPFLQSGANSLATLDYLMGVGGSGGTVGNGTTAPGMSLAIPGVNGAVNVPGVKGLQGTANTNLGAYGELMQQYPGGDFHAPTAAEARATPGYQFALGQGENAVDAGAAARGSLLTGGTLNAENQFAQGLADTNYNNVYNQALQAYNTNYNTWANNQANQFNRLSAMSGAGQVAAQQLGNAGMQSANTVSDTLMNTGQQVGQQMNNAAAATASGYMGSANAWSQGLGAMGSNMSQMMMLNQLMKSSTKAQANPYKTLYEAQQYNPALYSQIYAPYDSSLGVQ